MRRYWIGLTYLLAICLASSTAYAGSAQFLLDARTGEVIASENPDALNHPASLTKMMTLYLIFEAIKKGKLSWDSPVIFSKYASSRPPTKLRVKAGDKITVREAVLGMIVLSANDAATAMAETLGGTEQDFADVMTIRAHQLGMANTTFVNASGLPDDRQITTARDMSTLGVALMRDFPRDYALFSTRSFSFRGRTINGHNNLMYAYKGMDGIKTGYTNASGYNLVSAVADGKKRVVGVIMGGRTAASRDGLMSKLISKHIGKAEPGDKLLVSAAPPKAPQGPLVEVAHVEGTAALPVAGPAKVVMVDTQTVGSNPPQALAMAQPAKPFPLRRNTGWQVQIASAPTAEAAIEQLRSARVKVGGPLNERSIVTEAVTQNGATTYRARFGGFPSQQDAEGACRELVSSAFECTIVPGKG
ncbi:D-alanyl-D-alanine carboxypeptidase [Rhizobium oryzicola]|uniref:D-alanyl-D-alanine carboxypeptidase n=1 Tax=Rhizobium oryzicola TaxID=1232668 RepID=A0ABT8T3W3_9HYPH|nr:D-alanyl-D-alanine carboxypeptidase [Rhizobium oryzicola]MDO1585286.1 D-alanyl-D-alanine carboxypeptidase [Rhizobium oryzicola]